MEKIEIWKNIPWYKWDYKISNLWNIISIKYWKEKFLKQSLSNSWYMQCSIWYIHRLVAQIFIKNLENKEQVNHKDWNKKNNNLQNLEWCTKSENWKHAFNIWLNKITKRNIFYTNNPVKWKFWKDNHLSKKVNQYDLQLNFIKKYECISDIKKELWINISSITSVCLWNRKTAWEFIWKYS